MKAMKPPPQPAAYPSRWPLGGGAHSSASSASGMITRVIGTCGLQGMPPGWEGAKAPPPSCWTNSCRVGSSYTFGSSSGQPPSGA